MTEGWARLRFYLIGIIVYVIGYFVLDAIIQN